MWAEEETADQVLQEEAKDAGGQLPDSLLGLIRDQENLFTSLSWGQSSSDALRKTCR